MFRKHFQELDKRVFLLLKNLSTLPYKLNSLKEKAEIHVDD